MRVIEKATNFEERNTGVSALPVGVAYTDAKHGLVFDYMTDSVDNDMLEMADVLMVSEQDTIIKDLPTDFDWKHNFAGWEETKTANKVGTVVESDIVSDDKMKQV